MICAESGIAIIADNPNGNHLLMLIVSGPENNTIPAVADTDKINPKSIAHHGFHNNIDSVASARRGIPEPGLPLNKENMTTIAITAARRTLG
jgi:hypothetical protein